MFTSRFRAGVCLGVTLLSTMGCGGNDCGVSGLNVVPATATADHTAAAPGNGQTFSASLQFKNKSGCVAITAALVNSNWTASDPSVHLSSSPTSLMTAPCTAAVTKPATLTAPSADCKILSRPASFTCHSTTSAGT